ncbi:exonuclease SbcCD subunit D [Nocardioides sp. HDW12B]|uniref:exonuclease SbcCD subunit D n=1 Tax=Nocardioides sp. HDW12B TaxID=2714939 RepID=UPI001407BF16|nr:exonuclease SbcCD subunit D [Nocardioides sp. HDW12B]QIK66475.1 exonuclease SbcCD subunit D [Nocardioides sp. HDW12B]
MRILHTSDWHLGRSFHGVDLLPAQAEYLDHLVETVRDDQVDLVLVSGDVYDRALPPVDAVDLFSSTLARLAALRTRVVVTSGNHDSAIRLGVHAELADAAGIHLRTRWQDVGTPVVVEDRHGPVAVHGLPYLEPDAVRQAWQLPARSHEAALRAAMDRVRADLDARDARSVVMAHAFVAGSVDQGERMRSDSERDISVGGVQLVPTSVFADVSYAALGHLHGAANLSEEVRYSGSPLAYSFSEAGRTKGGWLVELGADGLERADFVPAPVHRPVATLRGGIEDLLVDPTHAGVEDAWLAVTLTDARRPEHAMDRLRARFPHTLTLAFEPEGGRVPRPLVVPHVSGRSDLDVALGFVAEVRELEPTSEEALLLQLACESCLADEDPDADRRGDHRLDLVGRADRGPSRSDREAAG